MTIRSLSAAVALGLCVAAVPAVGQESLLRVRLNADIRSSDPGVNRDGNTDAVMLHIVEGLVQFRENTSVGPMLAERIDTSADGRTYTFTLRQGVTFHNGAPLTSADVKASWDRYMLAATNWRCRPELAGGVTTVTSVETPDPRTVVFTLDRPRRCS
jgi:peptide/nickel transport system substrate-binding protein